MDNQTKNDRAIRIITVSKQSTAALTKAAMVFKPSDVKSESLDQKFRLSDGDDLTLNANNMMHVLIGKNGEVKCSSDRELSKESPIVNLNYSVYPKGEF